MDYYIGVDGGGTKTDAVLCDRSGNVLHRVTADAGNPIDIGIEPFCTLMKNIFDQLLMNSNLSACRITSVFAGVSGGAAPDIRLRCVELLKEQFPSAPFIDSNSDLYSILNGGLLRSDGCAVISGTGCSCIIRSGMMVRRMGGWGYLFDRQGGGFDIGRDAVSAVLCSIDGRGEKTILTNLLESRLGMPLSDAVPQLYKDGKRGVAAFAPLVFEAERQGDTVAHNIIEENMRCLADLVNTASADFKNSFRTVVTGGILTNNNTAFNTFRKFITCDTHPVQLNFPPVYGAVLTAMTAAGISDIELKKLTDSWSK